MRTLLLSVLLFSSVVVAAQHTSSPKPGIIATFPALLHEKLSSSCVLIQPVELRQYKQYDALALPASNDEVYSPELHKGDYVELSNAVPKEVAKSAKKSGFEVHTQSSELIQLNTKPVANGSSCADLQQVTAEANNQRYERRVNLQARVHDVGPDLLPPAIIQEVQPEPVAKQTGPQSKGQATAKYQGKVILGVVVGIDGRVQSVRVLHSLTAVLDKKAVEVVQQWKFSPARIKGLPVPAQMVVEVAFHLY